MTQTSYKNAVRCWPSLALLAAVALALAGVGSAGCGPDFDPYNRLTGLRMLAVGSDPPLPAAGQTATLSAVVFPPEPDPSLRYTWSWCPVGLPGGGGAGYPCLVTAEQLNEQLATLAPGATVPPTDLGTAPTAAFTHNLAPELLQTFCAASQGQMAMFPVNCDFGFPVQINVRIENDSDPMGIGAVWTLRLPTDPAATNRNPGIVRLLAEIDGVEQPLTDDPLVTLPRDFETVIRAEIAADAIETYFDPDPDREPTTADGRDVPERLFLSWFIESGDTGSQRTGTNYGDGFTIPVAEALERARKNKWTPAKAIDYPGETARLYVVIGDNRGGIGSASATVRLGEER